MKKMSKAMSVIICLLLALTILAGCARSSSGQTTQTTTTTRSTTTTTAQGSQTQTTTEPEPLEIITVTAFSTWVQKQNNLDSPVAQVILEKTGIRLEVEYAVGDADQKMALMAASNDYTDILPHKEKNPVFYNAGVLLRLDELIDEFAPNYKKLMGDYLTMTRFSYDDPYIYIWSDQFAPHTRKPFNPPNTPFLLQHAVVMELGYPEIKTLEDYENAIKAYYALHPTIDGQDTIPLSIAPSVSWTTLNNPAFIVTGEPSNGEWFIDPETGRGQFHFTREIEKEYYRWLNRLNDEGILDAESMLQPRDQYLAKLASGRVLGTIMGLSRIPDAIRSLKAEGKEDRTYGAYPVAMEGYESSEFWNNYAQYTAGYGISTTSPYAERIIKLLDFYVSEEGQVLINWGIEGDHYNVVNGKRQIIPAILSQKETDINFESKTGINIFKEIFNGYAEGAMDSTGDYIVPITPETIVATYTDIEKEVLSNYNVTIWRDLFKTDFPQFKYPCVGNIPFAPESDGLLLYRQVQQVAFREVPKLILVKPSEFDASWDAYMDMMVAAGLNELNEAFYQEQQLKFKLWGVID